MWKVLGVFGFAGIVTITLLVAGQLLFKKFTKVAYSLWICAGIFIIYFVWSLDSANRVNGDWDKLNYVGRYKLDYKNSFYDSIDLSEYKDLLLIVNSNKTFEFTRKTPFFTNQKGEWQQMDDGDISWTEISVGGEHFTQANIDKEKWVFSGNQIAKANNKNAIIFIKQ